jgi:hypothetical protein
MVGILTVAVTWYVSTGVGERFNPRIPVYAAIMATVAVALVAFIMTLAAAPWRLHEAQAARIREFERRPDVEPLIALRERGVQLLNSDDQLVFLEMELRRWENETAAELEKCAAKSDVSWFRVLGQFDDRVFLGATVEVNREKAMLSERLDRLLVIIRRLEDAG